jgi:hypothetical protein
MFCEYHVVVVGSGARNTKVVQLSNHKALSDIDNLIGAMSVCCNVSKDGILE